MQQQPFIDIASASDSDILAIIEAANQQGLSVNLNIQANAKNIAYILSKLHCQRCGKCCTTGTCPGVRQNGIPIHPLEITKIANFLKTRARKVKKLCFSNDVGGYSLPYPCPFYTQDRIPKCSIYSVRPLTCRRFPLYSIMSVNRQPMLTIDADCPEAKDFALQHYRSMREAIRRDTIPQ